MARTPAASADSLNPIEPATLVVQRFGQDYSFPVYFTRDVFRADNPVFRDALTRLEAGRRHRLLFVVDQKVAAAHPRLLDDLDRYVAAHARALELAGDPVVVLGGEAVKQGFVYVLRLLRRLNDLGIDRHSYVVACGGGAVLDMAGFAAAIAHRGVRTVRLPTTVLSQGDSGVGVKNGVNLFGKKNFAGAFLPPFGVINDFRFLDTLDHRDKVSGIAEAIKVALVRDRMFYEQIEARAGALARGDAHALAFLIWRSAELHLQHIRASGDPFELGMARPLDFGHWSAHKLEAMTAHRLRHGEAVAIGMALDLIYASLAGYLSRAIVGRVLTLLEAIGFVLWDEELTTEDEGGRYLVLSGLREFREHLGGSLHVTLLRDIGVRFEVTTIDEDLMVEAILALRERAARCSSKTA